MHQLQSQWHEAHGQIHSKLSQEQQSQSFGENSIQFSSGGVALLLIDQSDIEKRSGILPPSVRPAAVTRLL